MRWLSKLVLRFLAVLSNHSKIRFRRMPPIVAENEDRIVTKIDMVAFQETYNLGKRNKQITRQEASQETST